MEKKNFMQKLKDNSWMITLMLLLVVFLQTCSNSKKYAALRKKVDSQEQLLNGVATKKDLKIEGFEISKRMLYDNNAIIRTTVRPDDRMNQYDEEIKKIQNGQ